MSTLHANRVESKEALREATAAVQQTTAAVVEATAAMGEAKAALRAAEAAAFSAGAAAESAEAAFGSIDALWKEGVDFDREFCDLSTAASSSKGLGGLEGAQQVEVLGSKVNGKCFIYQYPAHLLAHFMAKRVHAKL